MSSVSTGNVKEEIHLQTGDTSVQSAGLQTALFRGSCRVSRVCSGIPASYVGLGLGLGSVFDCMSPVEMMKFKSVCMCVCVCVCVCDRLCEC